MEELELAAQVRDLFPVFVERAGCDLSDPAAVWERCVPLSTLFVKVCQENDVPARVVQGARFGEMEQFPGVPVILEAHAAAVVDDEQVVVDWTARQFDPDAPVPLVETLQSWRARWAPLSGSAAS